jgi:hypothetical protein
MNPREPLIQSLLTASDRLLVGRRGPASFDALQRAVAALRDWDAMPLGDKIRAESTDAEIMAILAKRPDDETDEQALRRRREPT